MTDNHPITPPPELVQQWYTEADNQLGPYYDYIATQAARWGSDQELEACCEWVRTTNFIDLDGHDSLRSARRPKPPSLKELALSELSSLEDMGTCNADTIRRALEQLPD